MTVSPFLLIVQDVARLGCTALFPGTHVTSPSKMNSPTRNDPTFSGRTSTSVPVISRGISMFNVPPCVGADALDALLAALEAVPHAKTEAPTTATRIATTTRHLAAPPRTLSPSHA